MNSYFLVTLQDLPLQQLHATNGMLNRSVAIHLCHSLVQPGRADGEE